MSEDSPDDWRFEWLRTRDIPAVAQRIQTIREGTRGQGTAGDTGNHDHAEPDPAGAIRLLREFARRREPDDLAGLRPGTEEAGGFADLDAAAVLTIAALTQPVREAARLAARQWEIESARHAGSCPLTDSVVHDVTAQRIVPEVAEFIAECRRRQHADLVEKILSAFVPTSSGRTAFDKALLYIILNASDCASDAGELLRLTLEDARTEARLVAGSADEPGIVTALHHLSPARPVVEDWIEERLAAEERAGVLEHDSGTLKLVASLLIGERDVDTELARYVGNWEPLRLVVVCERLAVLARAPAIPGLPAADSAHLAGRAQARLALVRGYAAARPDKVLAEIIRLWHKPGKLSGTLTDLFDDIAAGGAESRAPRSVDLLDALQDRLKRTDGVPDWCCRELRRAAAVHFSGRTEAKGADVARLLGKVGHRELRHAAQEVNRLLTRPLLGREEGTGREAAAIEKFVAYVHGLQDLPRAADLTFWALHALSGPVPDGRPPAGRVIAGIAVRVHAEVRPDIGFDLLERYLENEQGVGGKDAADIVERVRDSTMHGGRRWDLLLSATVGHWADAHGLDAVEKALRGRGFDSEADAIIDSLQ